MPRLFGGALVLGVGQVAGGIILGEPTLLAAAVLSSGFGLMIIAVGRLLQEGHDATASSLLAAGVYITGLLAAILVPGAGATPAMLPILSVVLLLPGRGRRAVAVILAVAIAGSGLVLLLGSVPHPFPPLREPLGSAFESATLLVVALLVLGALTDFAFQAQRSLDSLRQALRSQVAASAERTAIVASLGKIQRRDTIEATAELIVDALMKLPDIDLAGVFACEEGELDLLAVTGPPGFPVKQGDVMPAARARHLLERMHDGPWAELWTNDPAYEGYGESFSATGIKGQAFAPFFDGGVVIGFVGIGTLSDSHAEHFLTDLPAVAEFAATASLLLTPLLLARRETATARDAIEAIIATDAYRPVFQPIVELETGTTVGFEALTRFVDGRRPDLVFGAAERAGLGLELELMTLKAAIHSARDLPVGTWLSLNVSPRLVVEATSLAAVLAQRDRPLVLEITEHVAIDDYRAVRSAIDQLGPDVRVAVDDAGAGIANFSHLVELRPRLVKVDAGLIRDVDTDLARQAVVVGLVHFAAKAGCEVIAEGIETEAERATALALGVTHGQGFLIARPAPVGDFGGSARVTPARRAKRATRTRSVVPAR